MSVVSAMRSAIIRVRGWIVRNTVPLLAAAAFMSALVTYTTITGSDTPLGIKPRRVWTLVALNLGLLALLLGVVAARIYRLWAALQAGSIGSRLQKRVLILFSVVAIVPTITVSVFSAMFFNIGIQTWFNDRVQTAVNESLAVAEVYLSEHKDNLRADALAMAKDLSRDASLALANPRDFNRLVATQSAMRSITEAIVIQRNRIIAQGPFSFALAFERVPQDALERAARGEVVIMTSEDDKVRALVKLDTLDDGYLLVGRLVDSKVLNHMQSAQGAVYEYSALKTQLDRLQLVFSIIFVILAMLLLIASVGYGMVFAARLTNPISSLVMAAERVRGGDFSARVKEEASKDEIGTLARSFNRMTEQLQAQRGELIEANRRLDERRRFSEAVLSGVSAGVMVLNLGKKVTLFNRSSVAILNAIDQPIEEQTTIADILPGIEPLLLQAEQLPNDITQGTLTLNKNGKNITLHVRITVEKLGEEIEGFIVTFDDVTQLVSAQRTAAWADVARRIAHEIKNPLTPIQLSAERLKRKYLKFITEDQDSFIKYTDTIGKHVSDIGKMVEEFVSFARMPTPIFADEDFVAIIKKALFSAQVANPEIEYVVEMPAAPVLFHCDERQISQVVANVLKNAAEAIESRLVQQPERQEKGRIQLQLTQEGSAITVAIQDNGSGFPTGDINQVLEPYVTTRTKGTGLGLAIVKKIVEDHKGRINLENISSGGARVTLSFLQHCDI